MKGIKTVLTKESTLKRLGSVKDIACKSSKFIVPVLGIVLASRSSVRSVNYITNDVKQLFGVVTYNDAVNAVLDAIMCSDDKTKILAALKPNEKPELYQAVIDTVDAIMCSEDKVKIILNMCEKENIK